MSPAGTPAGASLFQGRELSVTLALGVITACGLLALYYFFMRAGYTLAYTRTIVFLTLLIDNILLTYAGRSFRKTIAVTSRNHNSLAAPILGSSVLFICGIYFIPFFRGLFELTDIFPEHGIIILGTSLISVGWFEVYKYFRSAGTASKGTLV